ncbi:dephospho-CoA kinase [Anaerolentibacter hominis]|uniref:dephospho-CoA kinase n=1 Tax=Anaerolentibacter hominis TaxID=3079009 RepID=UPI0031B8258E
MKLSKTDMKVIGLTGSVGSGKSTVAAILRDQYGACLLAADEIGRKLMEPGEISYSKIVEYFGPEIVKPDKTLNRARLSGIVFGDREKLKKLNSFVHPYVTEQILTGLKAAGESGKYRLAVVESAILFEVHYEAFCDEVWYVYADGEAQKRRLKESRGYTEDKIRAVLQNQPSPEEYRKHCDFMLDNSKSLRDLEKTIKKYFCVDN